MFDISSALEVFPECRQVHVVSVKNECKELLLLIENGYCGEAEIVCIELGIRNEDVLLNVSEKLGILRVGESISKTSFDYAEHKQNRLQAIRSEEFGEIVSYASPKGYLYEPNASIMKAGLYKTVAKCYNLQKLHPNTHLYTSDELVENFPGRSFKVERVTKVQRKEIQDIEKANLSIRNFPGNVADLRKKLKLKDGGNTYIFATTLHDNSKVLIVTEKVNSTLLIPNS